MNGKERLEEIKEHVKKIESILYDEWRQQELTILIESLYYDDHVDLLLNRIEELEKVIGDLDENVAAFETLWLEEKRKNQRYKQALENITISPIPLEIDDAVNIARQALKGE